MSSTSTLVSASKRLLEHLSTHHSEEIESSDYRNYKEYIESLAGIEEPIDSGTQEILNDAIKSNALEYSPLDCEYLMRTLNEHLENCIELRTKAQELETRAFTEVLSHISQLRLLETLTKQHRLNRDHLPAHLANATNATITDGAVISQPSKYWEALLKNQLAHIEGQVSEIMTRLRRFSEVGGAMNYGERYKQLKELYKVDIREAYLRGRAAWAGLLHVYGLRFKDEVKYDFPKVTDVGYLTELMKWARECTYALEKRLLNRAETTLLVAVSRWDQDDVSPLSEGDIKPELDKLNTSLRQIRFPLTEELFSRKASSLSNVRLRGLEVFILKGTKEEPPKYTEYYRAEIELPLQLVEVQNIPVVWKRKPQVSLPGVTYARGSLTYNEIPNSAELHNVSPIGDWVLGIRGVGVSGKRADSSEIGNIMLRLRVSYDKV